MRSSRSSISTHVRAAPGFTMSVNFEYTRQDGPEQPASVPSQPPTQMLMAIVRTRRTACPAKGPPLGFTVLVSAGHLQMPAAFPQYFHIGLFLMSCSMSQLEGLPGLKSKTPCTPN